MRFRCYRCRTFTPPYALEFEADAPVCPTCGAKGGNAVLPLATIHFIVMHADGPIVGLYDQRQYVACEPKRDHLAPHPHSEYAASDDPRAVTCQSCMGTKEFKQMAKLFPEMRARFMIEEGGCC